MAGATMCELHSSSGVGEAPGKRWEEVNAAPARKTVQRRRLWELRADYHCSICGTCLNLSDLRRVAGKAGFRVGPSATEHDVHSCFVRFASEPGRVAKAMQKLLDRKHRSAIERFRAMKSEAELRAFWGESLAKGDVSGPYWALMTHPLASERLMVDVFGDVHMLSHLLGASNRADIRRLNALERERQELSDALSGLRQQLSDKDAQARRLRSELAGEARAARTAEKKLTEARSRVHALSRGEAYRELGARIEVLERELDDATRTGHAERRRRLELEREASRLRRARDELNARVRDLGAECEALDLMLGTGAPRADGPGPLLDLGGRRIAYVGGRTGLIGHFRNLIEQSNGELIHHDGGVDESTGRLGRILGRADAVLCPIDCVSHGACLRAKQYCKRAAKPFVPLRTAGLSSFVGGLRQIAAATTRPEPASGHLSRLLEET